MEELTDAVTHDHVRVAVEGSTTNGVEMVPAQNLGGSIWLLLRSPLYALQLAAGDTIRTTNYEVGTFEIVTHGGNIAIQFYLPEDKVDDERATIKVASEITPKIAGIGGRLDGQTAGLIVYTIPVAAGFKVIEKIFEAAAIESPGAQWQYANVYDAKTGKPMCWWE